ncbi:MAG: hypothetical protein IKE20_06065, partial [Eggerthellaceae bacterium]|nr:hypothetical protein [Eggerthellaceae bacterium]
MAKLKIRDLGDRANELDRERTANLDRRRRAYRIAVSTREKMTEIQNALDSLPDDAPITERTRLI